MAVRSNDEIVDMPAEKMPATMRDERIGERPPCRMSGTTKSEFFPSRPGKAMMPVTPHHSMKEAENHMPSVPRITALNIVLWSFIVKNFVKRCG